MKFTPCCALKIGSAVALGLGANYVVRREASTGGFTAAPKPIATLQDSLTLKDGGWSALALIVGAAAGFMIAGKLTGK
jgi:hypothetical protein